MARLTGAEYQREYRKRHPERAALANAYSRAYRKKHRKHYSDLERVTRWKHPERRLLQLARARARRKGLAFDLKPGDLAVPTRCPVLGIELRVGGRGFTDCSPTVDRIDNSKGYVVGNVLVVSWRANRIKADATAEELSQVAAFYMARRA